MRLLLVPCLLLTACPDEQDAPATVHDEDLSAELAAITARLDANEAADTNLRAEVATLQATQTQAAVDLTALQAAHDADLASLTEQLAALEAAQSDIAAGLLDLQSTALDPSTQAAIADLLAVVTVDLPAATLTITGVNVYVQSGSGTTDDGGAPVGLGNLVLGYDEGSADGSDLKTGSHNLVIGPEHSYTGVGGIVAGEDNWLLADHSAILAGNKNEVSGPYSAALSGKNHVVSGDGAAVIAGDSNVVSSSWGVVVGGYTNTTAGFKSVIVGGSSNRTEAWWHCAILGGFDQECGEDHDTVY
jgi:hypothetical protein